MSRDFIGSKIAIITKSQCRYVGTIIGIDAQTSSIVLGSAKCYGTENRVGHITNGHKPGATLPIVQFANSDIDDLKIVDEEQTPETPQSQSQSMSAVSSQQQSIHDDPAIVSAVVGGSNKVNTSNSTISNRLIHNLQHMSLSDEQSKTLPKREGDIGAPWSLLSSSELERNNSSKQSDNKSKFFDDFFSNNNSNNNDNNNRTNHSQGYRSYQRSSNTNSTQTARENGNNYNGRYDDDNGLPARQPFFSNDRSYPQKQQYQQNRYQNGHQQRYFYNNRRPQMSYQQRHTGRGGGVGGGNRETFQNNLNDYDADFDFETSNQKFNKLTNDDDETKEQIDLTLKPKVEIDHSALYDKKKSFFDNLVISEPSDPSAARTYNRSKNTDTFGNDAYQRSNPRSNGNGYRRSNNNYRQHNNNNGYHYRY